MNTTTLIGRLTRKPELRVLNVNLTVATFTLAVSNRYNRDETDFFEIATFNKLAENCFKYLDQGYLVAVTGSIVNHSYTSKKDGGKRFTNQIRVQRVEFLSRPERAIRSEIIDDLIPLYDTIGELSSLIEKEGSDAMKALISKMEEQSLEVIKTVDKTYVKKETQAADPHPKPENVIPKYPEDERERQAEASAIDDLADLYREDQKQFLADQGFIVYDDREDE